MDTETEIIRKNIQTVGKLLFLLCAIFLLQSIFSHIKLQFSSKHLLNVEKQTEVKTAVALVPKPLLESGKPPQFVLFSFDGSKSLQMWDDTFQFAQDMNARNIPLKFTYFISAVYFLDTSNKNIYSPPRGNPGESAIGFSEGLLSTGERVKRINRAIAEGHEIGSHAGGHYDGSHWTYEEWMKEFSSFDDLVYNVGLHNNLGTTTLMLKKADVVGFRAPLLGVNKETNKALAQSGFTYDASRIGEPHEWPHKTEEGIWNIPLSSITLLKQKRQTISMDYSIYFENTKAEDVVRKGTPQWQEIYDDVYGSYLTHFDVNYKGNRAPFVIGHHFSLWNDAVYWQVMKDFAKEVCGKPEVRCGTFKDLVQYLNALPEGAVEKYNKGEFILK